MSLSTDVIIFLQVASSGLTLGSVYGAIALGIILIHNVTGVLNLAQGEFLILGGLSMYTLWGQWEWPFVLAFAASVGLTALLGLALQRLALKPAKDAPLAILFVITLAVAFLLQGSFLLIWGSDPMSLPSILGRDPINLLGVRLRPDTLLVFGMVVVLTLFIWFFFTRTSLGKALRASAENPRAASMIGINVDRVQDIAFLLAGVICGIAGVLIAPITFLSFNAGFNFTVKGVVAALIAGANNPYGGLVGGLVLGVLEAFGAAYISSLFQDAMVFTVLLVLLAGRTLYREGRRRWRWL